MPVALFGSQLLSVWSTSHGCSIACRQKAEASTLQSPSLSLPASDSHVCVHVWLLACLAATCAHGRPLTLLTCCRAAALCRKWRFSSCCWMRLGTRALTCRCVCCVRHNPTADMCLLNVLTLGPWSGLSPVMLLPAKLRVLKCWRVPRCMRFLPVAGPVRTRPLPPTRCSAGHPCRQQELL